MEKWERALHKFLAKWDQENVIGYLVCGSYVTGKPTDRSDIDVHIILSEFGDWRERGNEYVNGYLIEYFANPPRQIQQYFVEDYEQRRTMSMVQFITGKVLRDDTGELKRLKKEAHDWLNKSYETLPDVVVEIKKYILWDTHDNVADCFEQQRPDFRFTYYNALQTLFKEYALFLGQEDIPTDQVYAYLTDPLFLQKYVKTAFPDETFAQLFVRAVVSDDKQMMMTTYTELTEHVLHKMGGFDIDGWKIRTPVGI